jgi:hypothetical protein
MPFARASFLGTLMSMQVIKQGDVVVFLLLVTALSVALNLMRQYNIWDYNNYLISQLPATVWIIIGGLLAFTLGLMQGRSLVAASEAKRNVSGAVQKLALIFKKITAEITSPDKSSTGPEWASTQEHKAIQETYEGLLTYYAAFCCEMGYMTFDHYVGNFILAKYLDIHLGLRPMFANGHSFLQDDDNSTAPVEMTLQHLYRDFEKKKLINHSTKLSVDQLLSDTQLMMSNCYAMRGHSVDPVVTNILLWTIVFFCFTMPFYLCTAYEWYGVPCMMMLTYIYTGFYYSAIALAEPFGSDKTGYTNSRMSKQELQESLNLCLLSHGVGLEHEFHFSMSMLKYMNEKDRLGARATFVHDKQVVDRWHARNTYPTIYTHSGSSFI